MLQIYVLFILCYNFGSSNFQTLRFKMKQLSHEMLAVIEKDEMIAKKLLSACKSENFEIVKHILESNSLRDSATKSLVHSPKIFLVPLIKSKNEKILDFLLSQKELADKKLQLREIFSDEFSMSCYNGSLADINFLYSEKYKQYVDLSYSNYWCFRTAYKNNREDVLRFLIVVLGITRYIPDVNDAMRMEQSKLKEYCENLFSMMVMKRKIEKELPIKENEHKIKNKI